jgi:AcrR family transcriptional regulator
MTDTSKRESETVCGKAGYHHGGLREALIAAAFQLVVEKGAENFSLADACRLAGVSTAAPYRHFRDRDELMAEVTALAFDAMSANNMRAVQAHGEGTLEAIVAMGQAYLSFAVTQQSLFRLMFGQDPSLAEYEICVEKGRSCFGNLIAQITKYCEANGIEEDANAIALKMWTFVHGASALLIDRKYALIAPGVDIDELIATTVPLLLAQPAGRSGKVELRPDMSN